MSDGRELLMHLAPAVAGVIALEIRMRGCGPADVRPLYEVALAARHYDGLRLLPRGVDHALSVWDDRGDWCMRIWGVPVVEEKPDYAGPVIRGRT